MLLERDRKSCMFRYQHNLNFELFFSYITPVMISIGCLDDKTENISGCTWEGLYRLHLLSHRPHKRRNLAEHECLNSHWSRVTSFLPMFGLMTVDSKEISFPQTFFLGYFVETTNKLVHYKDEIYLCISYLFIYLIDFKTGSVEAMLLKTFCLHCVKM